MHNDNCETVIGKLWSEIGNIDWEGNYPVLDSKLRVIRVEFVDNIEDDESFVPVEIYKGRASRVSRDEGAEVIDAYMGSRDYWNYHRASLGHGIDMDPKREHLVRVEGDHDLICDLLGNAIDDRYIESFEVVDGIGGSKEPSDARDAIVDALTDLRHKALADGIDFDYALRLSSMHFNAERGGAA